MKEVKRSCDRISAAPKGWTWASTRHFKLSLNVPRVCRPDLIGTAIAFIARRTDCCRSSLLLEASHEHR
jgi:hypothetical protein